MFGELHQKSINAFYRKATKRQANKQTNTSDIITFAVGGVIMFAHLYV